MVEALVTLALSSMILAALATVTHHWLPNWKAGFSRLQSSEGLYLGLNRAAADLAAAEFVSPGPDARQAYFKGTRSSAAFVRSAIGPNSAGGLEFVRLREKADGGGLVRETAPFATSGFGAAADEDFGGTAALIGSPFQVTFAFAGSDHRFQDSWQKSELPAAVRVIVRSAGAGKILSISTATLVRAGAPAECVSANSAWGCLQEGVRGAGGKPPGPAQF